jgi:hypothetical protein
MRWRMAKWAGRIEGRWFKVIQLICSEPVETVICETLFDSKSCPATDEKRVEMNGRTGKESSPIRVWTGRLADQV